MAVAYKGFRAYYVDPDTLEVVAGIGDFVVTFTNHGYGPEQTSAVDLQGIIQYMGTAGHNTGEILSLTPGNTELDNVILGQLQQVIPATVRFPGNGTGSRCKVKLESTRGYYAVSVGSVNNGSYPTNLTNWDLYDADDNLMASSYSWPVLLNNMQCMWFSQPGFNGTLQDATFYSWRLVVDSYIRQTYVCLCYSDSITNRDKFVAWINQIGPLVPPDPYEPGGTSGPGGGTDGTFDFTSTDVPIPPLPGIGAVNTGFLTLYKPTAGELQSTAPYMWSGAFDPDNLRKLFANPMDAILGLHIVPTASGHPAAAASTLQIGNISTGLSMARVTEQYYELDCGTIMISPKWGAYLDYSPYSKLSLYLPYIGIVEE